MSETGVRRGVPATARSVAVRGVVVALASALIGAATFFAQGLLPAAVVSFANSASGWTLVTVVLLLLARLRPGVSALLGGVSFVLLTCGYAAAAGLTGLYYNPLLFGVVGVVAGPFVGLATAWLRSTAPGRVAPATALLAGIGLGEAVYGLTVVAETTSPVYWILIGLTAVALLVTMVLRRLRGWFAAAAVVGTLAVALAFRVAYLGLGGL
ncbi:MULTISPECIES: DUF6518 family protein [Pseudonocardia]|uniref:Uncharacterized protein n=2 Tax=Pseudonocardia TaxID=1847 RepID=A0A1Y2MWG0_PSEAH|nr:MULTISPECIES: DUF6518 family protein [Pseudonocardia]OSY39471.1 hypothetical protein BG845_03417 [Pseudonocardia autotrophica]TDN75291.1 hypothetical protein C8E95_4440 [Pseudonocardia autotrophica]BBF99237.1 hypothetical protein Pdca_04470 [Pseudonocardia autotrophica]GEC24783.1 hypothetical protein PSA01_18120 [Pseudonocardia saturnea]